MWSGLVLIWLFGIVTLPSVMMCSGIINDFATIVTDSIISASVSDFILPIKHIIIVIVVIKFSPA